MSIRFRDLGAGIAAVVVSAIVGAGTAFAAAPAQTETGGNGIFDNFLVIVLGGVLLALFAALSGGAVIAFLAVGLSRFFRRNLPTDEEMSDLRALATEKKAARKPLAIGPSMEPFVMAAVGFIAAFVLGGAMLAAQPQPVQGNSEEALPVVAGLPRDGDFTKIVSELPPGDAANGSKLYVSSGCSGCHSLDKDKRLVGPSFYNVYDQAKKRVTGLGPKEYLYQSIVNPNAHVVDTFQANIMNQTYATQLNPKQMADILAWIERDHSNQQ